MFEFSLDVAMRACRGGFVCVITGAMFAGKTECLLQSLSRVDIANDFVKEPKKIVVFKPARDVRTDTSSVVPHNNSIGLKAVMVADVAAIAAWFEDNDADVIGIDEAQFFNVQELYELISRLADQGKVVILTVLDQDYLGEPFDGVPEMLSKAEFVIKLHPVCKGCGLTASRSRRLIDSDEQIVVGGSEAYAPYCRTCYNELFPDLADRE